MSDSDTGANEPHDSDIEQYSDTNNADQEGQGDQDQPEPDVRTSEPVDRDQDQDLEGEQEGEQETPVEVNWQQAQSGFRQRQNERRELLVELPPDADVDADQETGEVPVAKFTLRGLDRDEQDDVERRAANLQSSKGRRQRSGGDVDVDTGKIRDMLLEFGIDDGPPGFKPHRKDHRDSLPPGVADRFVDEIEAMSSLEVSERDAFQGVGSG